MAVHTIMLPDRMRGLDLRSIVWDDEAGTVEGDHDDVPWLRSVLAGDKPVTVGDPGGTWDLRDPAHDPAEMLVLLYQVYWPALDKPLRATLPTVFDGVELPPAEKGEALYVFDEGAGQHVELV